MKWRRLCLTVSSHCNPCWHKSRLDKPLACFTIYKGAITGCCRSTSIRISAVYSLPYKIKSSSLLNRKHRCWTNKSKISVLPSDKGGKINNFFYPQSRAFVPSSRRLSDAIQSQSPLHASSHVHS